jgi:signal transduction histidine kinase
VLGLVAVLVFTDPPPPPAAAAVAAASLAVLAASYAIVGRRALGADDVRLALAYLFPAWAAFLVLATVDAAATLLLFSLVPQVWACFPSRWQSAAWIVGGMFGLFLVLRDDLGTGDAAMTMALNAGLALLLGLWISGIVEESAQRAALIQELERTRSELAVAERDAGGLAERARLAGEIHDTLAQGFTSVLTLAQAVDAALDTDLAVARERLALLERTARDNLAEARALVTDLGPVDLHRGSLPEALRRLVTRFTEETGTTAALAVTGTERSLAPNAEVVLLRATQEALANVRRHSGARTAHVRLAFTAAGAEILVRDDGAGFDPSVTAQGFGLSGLRLRAAQVGGTVTVTSTAGHGTTVRLSVPGDAAGASSAGDAAPARHPEVVT